MGRLMDEFGLAPPTRRKKKPLSGDLSEFAGPITGLEGYETTSPFGDVTGITRKPLVTPSPAEAISTETEQRMDEAKTWLDKAIGGKPKTLAFWGAMGMGFKPTTMVDGKVRLAEAGSTKELDTAPDWLQRAVGHEKGKTKFIPGIELNKEDLAEFRRIETVWKANKGQTKEFIQWLELWAAVSLALWYGGQTVQGLLAFRALQPPGMRFGPKTFQRLAAKITTPLKYKGLGTIRGGATTKLLESPLLPYPQQYGPKGPPGNLLEEWIMTISRGQVPTAHPYIGQFRSPIQPPIVQQMSKVDLAKFSISAQDLVNKLGYKLSPETIQGVVNLATKVSTTKPMAQYTMVRLAAMLSKPETAEATKNAMAGLMATLSKPRPSPGQQKLVEVQPEVPERRVEKPPTAAEVARAGKEELSPDWLFSKEKPTEQLEIGKPAPIEKTHPLAPRPPNDRWVVDPGAAGDEPIMTLDGDLQDGVAAILEHEDEMGMSLYEARTADDKGLGHFQTIKAAAQAAEKEFPVKPLPKRAVTPEMSGGTPVRTPDGRTGTLAQVPSKEWAWVEFPPVKEGVAPKRKSYATSELEVSEPLPVPEGIAPIEFFDQAKFPETIGGGLDSSLKIDLSGERPFSCAIAKNRRLNKTESEQFRQKLEELTGLRWKVDTVSKSGFFADTDDLRKLMKQAPYRGIIDKALSEGKAFDEDWEEAEPAAAPTRPMISEKAETRANKFHDLAAGLQKQIDTKLHPAISDQPLTARRARIAASMSADAEHLRRIQEKLNAIANAIEDGILPKSLRGIKNKKQVEFLHSVTKYEHEYPKHKPGEYDHIKESVDRDIKTLASMDIDSERAFGQAKKDFKELKAEVVPSEADEAGRIRRMEMDLIDRKIPGFFVTPRPVIERMLGMAEIEPGMSVLEPSAGKGDIADAIRETHPGVEVSTAEISSQLRGILEAKGHKIVGQDIFEHAGKYDRIIANPPFEKGQDVSHVKHYWNLLKPSGRMIVIMGEHPFFASDKKATGFREWLESVGGVSEQLPSKSFTGKESFRQTGVAARVVTIDKPLKAVQAPAETRAVPIEKGKVPSKRLVKLQKELQEVRQKLNSVLNVHTEMLAEQFLEAPKGKRYPVYTDEEVGPGDLIEWRGEKSMRHEFLRDYTTKQVKEALKKRKGSVWEGIKRVARQELLEGGEGLEGKYPPDPQFADLLGMAYELSEQILAIEQPEAVLSDEMVKLYGGFGLVSGSPFLRLPAEVEQTINQGAKATFHGAKDAVMRFFLKYESLRQINKDAAKRFEALEYGAFQTELQAVEWVKEIQKTYNVKDNELASLADAVELGKRQPAILASVPDNVRQAAQTIIALNEWLLAELKKRPGIYPGRFPDGQIKAFKGKIKVTNEKIARLRRDMNAPTATGKEAARIQKLAEKIAKYNLGIQRFQDLRYLHHLVLHDKVDMRSITRIVEKGLRALKPSKYTIGVGRKVGTVRELDQLHIPHEKNPIVATGHHLFVALREIRKYDFLEQFKQDIDLVRKVGTPEAEENKADFSTIADLPQFKDYIVHEALIQAMREYAAPGQETKFTRAWLRFTNIVKQIKFYLPHIMVLNNLQQAILTGSALPIHFRTGPKGLIPLHDAILLARRSWQMHRNQSDEYKAVQTLGLFSRAVSFEENVLLDLRSAFKGAEGRTAKMNFENWFGVKFDKAFWDGLIRQAPVRAVIGGAVGFASGVFTGSSIPGAIIGGAMAVAPKEFYHALRHLTWTTDRIQRIMSYLHYRRQGLSIEQAVLKAKTVHADYDMLRAPLAKALTAILLTPKYKAAMLKLHKDMLISLGPKGFRSELSGPDTPAFRGEFARYAMYKALFILALGLSGWRLTQWYRATKQEPSGDEERVHVAYGPVWEPEKYAGRLRIGEPIRDVGDFATRILNTIYPYTSVPPHVLWSIQRKRDWKGDKIWSKGQPAWEQIARITAFAVREIIAPLSMAEMMSEEERTIGQNILALFLVSIYKRKMMQGYMGGRMRAEQRILTTLNKQDEETGELTDDLKADRERDLDEWLVAQTKRIIETEYRQREMSDTSKSYPQRIWGAYGVTPGISEKEIRARMKELMKTPKRKKRKRPSLIKKYGLPAPGG